MTTYTYENEDHNRPLPTLPRLIFLDTNVVQNLQTFSEYIYDKSPSLVTSRRLSALGPRIAADIYALADLIALGQRAGWPIAVSSRTLRELESTARPGKRASLLGWGTELAHYFDSHFYASQVGTDPSRYRRLTHFTFSQRSFLSDKLKELPDQSDRQLIIDAMEIGCDIFLSMDYRTIWHHRDEVNRLGLQVMRPVELLEYVSPWAGLLR